MEKKMKWNGVRMWKMMNEMDKKNQKGVVVVKQGLRPLLELSRI